MQVLDHYDNLYGWGYVAFEISPVGWGRADRNAKSGGVEPSPLSPTTLLSNSLSSFQ